MSWSSRKSRVSRVSALASRRAYSRMPSTSAISVSPDAAAVVRWRRCASPRLPSSSSCSTPMTPFSGRAQLVADDREKARFGLIGRHRRAARALGGIVLGKGLVAGLFKLGGALDHLALERRIGFAQVSGHPVE